PILDLSRLSASPCYPLSFSSSFFVSFFFFNDPATTEIYTLSLHDALPIYFQFVRGSASKVAGPAGARCPAGGPVPAHPHGGFRPFGCGGDEQALALAACCLRGYTCHYNIQPVKLQAPPRVGTMQHCIGHG